MVFFSKSDRDIKKICLVLRQGEVVAAPTETAYGLLCDATNKSAVARLAKLKGRRGGKFIPLVVSDYKMACRSAIFSPLAFKLARRFWPGPLTLVLPSRGEWSVYIAGPDHKVGWRLTGSAWLRKLIRTYGRPLTATSANISGAPAGYDYESVASALQSCGLKYIVRARRLPSRTVSTVVEVIGEHWRLLRSGAVSLTKLKTIK